MAAGVVRCGIVGAGRTRIGLGPFLASHLEAAGGEVVAVAGRDAARAGVAALGLGERLGHPVAACASVEALCTSGIDALVVSAPIEAHRRALVAAAAAGVSVLCEKPLVTPREHPEVPSLVAAFRRAGLLLMENCQWPMTLDAWRRLYPAAAGAPLREFRMRLSPAAPGPQMLVDSLSHVLSMLQELLPVGAATGLTGLSFRGACDHATGLTVEFTLEAPFPPVACRIELVVCETQPRPAWYSLDGRRAERRIELPAYRFTFHDGERSVPAGDPTAALVYRFLKTLREASIERYGIEADRVEQRARLFLRVARGLDEHLDRGRAPP